MRWMRKHFGKKFLLEISRKIWYHIVCKHTMLADDFFSLLQAIR